MPKVLSASASSSIGSRKPSSMFASCPCRSVGRGSGNATARQTSVGGTAIRSGSSFPSTCWKSPG